jgi:hypothetical protein
LSFAFNLSAIGRLLAWAGAEVKHNVLSVPKVPSGAVKAAK